MDDKIIKEALMMVVLDALSNIEDLGEVCDYNFEMPVAGNRLKGVVKVEFEEVE